MVSCDVNVSFSKGGAESGLRIPRPASHAGIRAAPRAHAHPGDRVCDPSAGFCRVLSRASGVVWPLGGGRAIRGCGVPWLRAWGGGGGGADPSQSGRAPLLASTFPAGSPGPARAIPCSSCRIGVADICGEAFSPGSDRHCPSSGPAAGKEGLPRRTDDRGVLVQRHGAHPASGDPGDSMEASCRAHASAPGPRGRPSSLFLGTG